MSSCPDVACCVGLAPTGHFINCAGVLRAPLLNTDAALDLGVGFTKLIAAGRSPEVAHGWDRGALALGGEAAPPARGRRWQWCQPPPSVHLGRLKGVSHGSARERLRLLRFVRVGRGGAVHRQVPAQVPLGQLGPGALRPHGHAADAADGPPDGLRVLRPQGGILPLGEERVPVAPLQPVRRRGRAPRHDDDGPHPPPLQGRGDRAGQPPTPLPQVQCGEEVGPHIPRRVAGAAAEPRWTAARRPL